MIVTNVYPLAKLWKVIVKHCVESLRQALEVIHEVWTTCTLFVQPFNLAMTDSSHDYSGYHKNLIQ